MSPLLKKLDILSLPLQGVQLIEASAGTGKTWTLAALYVRLVLGHGRAFKPLMPSQILVMTFTEAATAELRERIRDRLVQAARFFKNQDAGDAFLHDLQAELGTDQNALYAQQLDQAAQSMDQAAVLTIHSWCSRMLRQHAFESRSLFDQKHLDQGPALKLRLVKDYWRRWLYPMPENHLGALRELGASPEALLRKLAPMWQQQDLLRQQSVAETLAQDPLTQAQAWVQWRELEVQAQTDARQVMATHSGSILQHLAQALANDLKGTIYRAHKHAYFLSQLQAWGQGEELDLELLEKFTWPKISGSVKAAGAAFTDAWGLYAAFEKWQQVQGQEPQIGEGLLRHAAQQIGQAYAAYKSMHAAFDFSDLLKDLFDAVKTPASHLPEVIRQQFPVALVDEFQDTDPWQYGTLQQIYAGPPEAATLIMIGDPKQAIYSFRGADLPTYMAARTSAQAVFSLTQNHRSSQAVVAAVNHVFGHAQQPFDTVSFEPVETCMPPKALGLRGAQGQHLPGLTLWHWQTVKALSGQDYAAHMAQVCASEMVKLLNQEVAKPGQMAVLVRDGKEAKHIRQALAQRGVRSVYLSDRESVFASREALDLACILLAVVQARNVKFLRAALTTRTLSLSLNEIEFALQDEAAWDLWVERFNAWHQTWQRQGFLPMLNQILHEQEIGQRMQALGDSAERRLTNLLHLGDLLQKVSSSLQGESALLRYLNAQLIDPNAQGEAAQMRLETDADLVQVITQHKAKGLEYPLVFLPFAANFRPEEKGSSRDDAQRLWEDIRLLYVAMTRAKQAMWLGVANRSQDFTASGSGPRSALSYVLGRRSADDLPGCLERLKTCDHIEVVMAPEPLDHMFVSKSVAKGTPTLAKTPSRSLPRAARSASFSALTRHLGGAAGEGVDAHDASLNAVRSEWDERMQDAQIDSPKPATQALGLDLVQDIMVAETQPAYNAFPAGSAYGSLLHDVFEWQLREGWPLLQEINPQDGLLHARWQQWWKIQANSLQLTQPEQTLMLEWVKACACAQLPLGCASTSAGAPQQFSLSQLHLNRAWPEMGFTLLAHGLSVQQMDQWITEQLHPGHPRETLQPRNLEGMLTGFMDLIFEQQGRYYVLDYKSNKLPQYDAHNLLSSLLSHRYDVQYTLYVLALHRLLKSRLVGYQYAQHMGGAVYLFARGIDQPGQGVYSHCPPQALIEKLDQAFATISKSSAQALVKPLSQVLT
jgi:exodeoxyribonuclease V beta subunit